MGAFLSGALDIIRIVLDILVIAWLVYNVYKLLLRSQTLQLVRGIALIIGVFVGANLLKLETLSWILNLLAPGLIIALAIIFQPELRKIFSKLGQGYGRNRKGNKQTQLDSIINAAEILAEKRRGALIVFSRNVNLDEIIERGTKIDGEVSSSLILTIFEFDTSLHDGAVIIKENRIVAAGCFLPLSNQSDIKLTFGTRHRAALGITETTDAVVLIVSEETGAISLAYDSKLFYNLSSSIVKKRLGLLLAGKNRFEGEEGILENE